MLIQILNDAKADLADASEEKITSLEAAYRVAEQERADWAASGSNKIDDSGLRIAAQRAREAVESAKNKRADALLTVKRFEPLVDPKPPKGAAAAIKRLTAVRAEHARVSAALESAEKDETVANAAMKDARQRAGKALAASKLNETGSPLADEKKSLVTAISDAEVASLAVEEIRARLAEANAALKVATDEANDAREAIVLFEFHKACSAYLKGIVSLLPLAATIRAGAQLLEYSVPDGVTDGRLLGLDFGMGEKVAAARAGLLNAKAPE